MVLDATTITVLIVAFLWSGFVRAGLGFGGAGLMYPIALLVVDSVLFLVPIISLHVLVFSSATLVGDWRLIDWAVLRWLVACLILPFLAGVLGLINLPETVVLFMVYVVVVCYALVYLYRGEGGGQGDGGSRGLRRWLEWPGLIVGGYATGLALAGAPLIAAIVGGRLPKERFRATLFVLWPTMVLIKLATLIAFDVDLQLRHQWWLFPAALVGHLLGLRVHDHLLQVRSDAFYRWLGAGLLAVSVIGMWRHLAA